MCHDFSNKPVNMPNQYANFPATPLGWERTMCSCLENEPSFILGEGGGRLRLGEIRPPC